MNKTGEALSLLVSIIKSGEAWSPEAASAVAAAREELTAAARVLAVASDLLAALIDMTERVDGTLPAPGGGASRAVDRARAAILKATGEAAS